MKHQLSELLKLTSNIQQVNISLFDEKFLEKSVNKRLDELGLSTVDAYLLKLQSDLDEITFLNESLHINYSEFFRNSLTFSYLEQIIIPRLFETKKANNGKEIRIWSAACAAGQEAYSIAILFDEYIKKRKTDIRYRIFATDACQKEIDFAHKGVYPAASINKVSFERIQKYFTQTDNNYSIDTAIKENVDFSVFDLLGNQLTCPPASIFGNFDIIFCSNILFYYKPEIRKIILDKLAASQSNNSYIITGETEREILKSNNYREVFFNSAIFQSAEVK